MSVATTNITSGPYSGNDVAVSFAYGFRVNEESQLRVFEINDLGVETELTLTTHYTVAGVDNDTGGQLTRVAGALPTGYTWYVRSNYTNTQLTVLASQGGFFPDVHEKVMDNLTFQNQQQEDKLNRSMHLSDSDSSAETADMTLPVKSSRIGTVLAFDATSGDPVAGPTITTVETVAGIAASIATVATVSADVTTVATVSADVTTVAGVAADVTTVVAVSADVTTVAAVSADVTTVAAVSADVTTVAAVSADVTTVAAVSADVTTVAAVSADVTTVATNIAAIIAAPTHASNAATSEANAAASAAVSDGANKLPLAGGHLTGAVTTDSTIDGREIAEDGTKLDALATNNSGATEPVTKYPYMFWADIPNDILKLRNANNTNWIDFLKLSTGTTLTPALAFHASAGQSSGSSSANPMAFMLSVDINVGGLGDTVDGSTSDGTVTLTETGYYEFEYSADYVDNGTAIPASDVMQMFLVSGTATIQNKGFLPWVYPYPTRHVAPSGKSIVYATAGAKVQLGSPNSTGGSATFGEDNVQLSGQFLGV